MYYLPRFPCVSFVTLPSQLLPSLCPRQQATNDLLFVIGLYFQEFDINTVMQYELF